MTTAATERQAALEGALVQPRPDLGALVVTGPDRQGWLNGLVTCELAARRPGDGVFGLAVGKTGKILAELWVLLSADHLVIGAAADRIATLHEHFDRHLIMEDVELAAPSDRGWLAVHGPLAEELVLGARELGADAASVDFTGRGGAAILAPPRKLEEVRDALLARAGERGALATADGWEALRIEWGVPRFGVDYDDQTLPQEASLERLAVSFTKGCYLGQETVFMLEKRGHAKKRLMRLSIEGEAPVAPGAELALPDGAVVGTVTSQGLHPSGGAVLALGYVKYKHAAEGTALVVAGRPARALGLVAEPKGA